MRKKSKSVETPRQMQSNKILCKDGKVKKKKSKLFTLYRCDICPKEFPNKYYLSTHKQCHTTDTPYACTQCSYKGKTKKYLARHIKRIHKNCKEIKCNVCGRLFLYESHLKVHARVHSGEKPYACRFCGKTFRVPYSLNTHLLIHQDEKPFECSFCPYACRDSSTLRKHQNKHMGLEKHYICTICNKPSKSKAALKLHISEKHLEIDVKKYPCDKCDRVFKSVSHKHMHIKAFHDRKWACTCPVCGIGIASKYNLPQHMRTHLNERPFHCTHAGCDKDFKDKSSLKKHVVLHDTALHFPCSFCGKKFARKIRRDRHELILHSERKRAVTCDYCGSSFYTKNYLIKHIQTKHVHKQKFKYICDICGLTTYNKPSIVMHLKYGHLNDKDLQCKICEDKKVFKKHLYLKLHLWRSHNIRYKITRKATNKKKELKPLVDVKVEPIEADSYEDLELMEVDKKEIEDATEFDSLDYSKNVLSEDIALSVLSNKKGTEVEFDEFFIRHVFKQEDKTRTKETKDQGVDIEQDKYVTRKIKKILTQTEKVQKAKELRKKKRREEKLRKEKGMKDAMLKEEKARQEIIELRRVREMYNERMKAAVARENKKKDPVTIRYFKKIIDTNDTTTCNENNYGYDLCKGTVPNDKSDKHDDSTDQAIENIPSKNIAEKHKSTENINDNEPTFLGDFNKTNNQNTLQQRSENDDSKLNDCGEITNDGKIIETDEDYNSNHNLNDNEDDLDGRQESSNDNHDDGKSTNNDTLKKQTECYQNNDQQNDTETDLSDENTPADKIPDDDESWKNSDDSNDTPEIRKAKKMEFHTHQCFICFKLYSTEQELIEHCQEHFDVCNEKTLSKCPMCNHVSSHNISKHIKRKHNVDIKIPYKNINKNNEGSGYSYEVGGTTVDIIPSIKVLNKTASIEIDRKKRHLVENTVAKTKLVKKGNEWIVEKVAIDIKYDEIPELDEKELAKCNVSDNDVDRLGQLNYLAKKKGLKMMFPCFKCDKVCQGFSALKLHKRKHEDNPKPFAPRAKSNTKTKNKPKKVKLNKDNRTALPKPIIHKHKCDEKLKDFFENNIRGGDVEFWQFLKIFNKMDRENVNDFKDLEERTDFGIHFYKNVEDDDNEMESNDNDEADNDNEVTLEVRKKVKKGRKFMAK